MLDAIADYDRPDFGFAVIPIQNPKSKIQNPKDLPALSTPNGPVPWGGGCSTPRGGSCTAGGGPSNCARCAHIAHKSSLSCPGVAQYLASGTRHHTSSGTRGNRAAGRRSVGQSASG